MNEILKRATLSFQTTLGVEVLAAAWLAFNQFGESSSLSGPTFNCIRCLG